MSRWLLALWIGLTLNVPFSANADEEPAILLANVYRNQVDVTQYLVSEKLDGVRAVWDGRSLRFRSGKPIHAPAWFVDALPAQPLDGELWAGRGRFAHAQSTTRQQQPDDAAWRQMRLMVFDLPAHGGVFDERLGALKTLVASIQHDWVQAVPQQRVATDAALQALLQRTVRSGGEGLMLHCADAVYETGRSDTLLKLKPWLDAEAEVIGHRAGKGRHTGRLGALQIRMPEGKTFLLGTGFSDAQRQNPPPIGTRVTYRYRELTRTGLPRFASFLRVRED